MVITLGPHQNVTLGLGGHEDNFNKHRREFPTNVVHYFEDHKWPHFNQSVSDPISKLIFYNTMNFQVCVGLQKSITDVSRPHLHIIEFSKKQTNTQPSE